MSKSLADHFQPETICPTCQNYGFWERKEVNDATRFSDRLVRHIVVSKERVICDCKTGIRLRTRQLQLGINDN